MNWHTMYFILGDFPPNVIIKPRRISFLDSIFKTTVPLQCSKMVVFTFNRKKEKAIHIDPRECI